MLKTTLCAVAATLIATAVAAPSHAIVRPNGLQLNGFGLNGLNLQGIGINGLNWNGGGWFNGTASHGASAATQDFVLESIELPAALR